MATEGESGEQPFCTGEPDNTKDFNVENLSKPELRFLLSILEGELEARDLVIEALRARRKEVFVQERYGRFNLGDPFLALQRDFEAGVVDKEKKPICNNPLTILEAVMAHCRKMQERMSAQLAAAERRQRKLEAEKSQLQNLEQEHKKLLARLEEERTKNKHVVLILVKECKLLSTKIVEEAQKLEDAISKLELEKKKGAELEEALAAEKQMRSQIEAQMEAQIQKQLLEFDTEREHLRAKLSQEEAHTKELQDEIDRMKKIIEQLKLSREEDSKANIPVLRKNKDKHPLPGCGSRSVSCQTNTLGVDNDSEHSKRPPLTLPAKPSIANHNIGGSTKTNVCTNSAFAKPATDRQTALSDSFTGLPTNFNRTEENGCSSDGTSSSSLYPNIPFCTSPASPSYLSQSMQSLHSPCTNLTVNSGVSPRIQAAKFKFQANANEHDQNGNTTQISQTREMSPNNRENLAAKQMARNTVTQVLSRFTSSQAGAQIRPGYSHPIETGTYPPVAGRGGHPSLALKSTSVSRVDRGNPPPIPPKKPGLLQTPPAPHHPLKTPPNIGGKIDHKPITSAPSTSTHGFRVINEETVSKSSPQLPPKPSIDIPVASAGCVIPAIGTSQVGAWPSQSLGWNEPACSESSPVIPTTIACTSSIHPVSASSCRPCDSDSLLVTASGWPPSLTSLLTSGGPVLLGDRSTLLHQAAAQGNVTLLYMLLNEEGLDINNFCKDGYTALYSAAANGHTDCVKLLLTSGSQVDATVSNGFTALCAAAAQGHAKCAEVLLAYNADINYADGGQTPLYLACENGHFEIAKLLLDFGADRGVTTNNGWTPVHAAANSGYSHCLKLLMYYGSHCDTNEEDDLKNKDTCKLKPVIAATLLNSADSEGWTAAHIAASRGFKDCLEILCSHSGLEPEKEDKCNRTVHDVATDDCKQLLENLNSLRIPIRISLDDSLQICYTANEFESEDICYLLVHKHTTWDDFSAAVRKALLDHFSTIMSDGWESQEDLTFNNTAESSLGLGAITDLSFKLGNTSWSVGQVFLQTPWEFLKMSKVEQLSVYLPGLKDGNLNSVAYASMIPLQTLQNFLRLVEQYHNVIFQGPEGSLQEYLADHLSRCIKNKEERTGFSCDVVKVEVEPGLSKEQLVDIFINSGCLIPITDTPPRKKKTIIILEKLEKASLLDLLGDLMSPLDNRGSENPYCVQRVNGASDAYYFHEDCFLMGTVARPRLQGPELLAQQHFRWVQLRWDGEPMHSLLQKVLKRKVIHKFKGKLPPPSDPVCRGVDWTCAVWHQLNSCLSRLGMPEALVGPQPFMTCPIVPGNAQIMVKWISKLWNAVIVPKVEEAILSLPTVKRSSVLGRVTPTNTPSQGQQAVVKAALSILLNKAILHGCHIPKNDIEQHLADFKGGHFSLSMSASYKPRGKKKVENGAWRKVSTSPRKKSNLNSSWSKDREEGEGGVSKNELKTGGNSSMMKKKSLEGVHPRSLHMQQRLSAGSDDEADLVKELRAMCSSKSEPDITKIAELDNCLVIFKTPSNGQNSATVKKTNPQMPNKNGACPPRSSQTSDYSEPRPKAEPGSSQAKSLLPIPRTNRKSSSNTRQIAISIDSKEELWSLHNTNSNKQTVYILVIFNPKVHMA
ncbi:LOW QUALITY PROTEIN: cortactin-binding protein 2 [Hyperolius riggenbachi]|uniref:LOW QUALITY PROTEIN: cortactin-binding protein 2 n=1 Tax=Hyperolius riggenbachi TaxID=752182 RepID=UPI0035A36603